MEILKIYLRNIEISSLPSGTRSDTLIRGFFRNGAGFINIHLISESMDIDETVEFQVDTGASRTTLLDKDTIYLGLN